MANAAKTLLDHVGIEPQAASLSSATLVLIDVQNEYFDADLALPDGRRSLAQIESLLQRARALETPVVHVEHHGSPEGGIFSTGDQRSQIVDSVKPIDGEACISKSMPNAFTADAFDDALKQAGCQELIVIGYMTHMCISSTVRAAVDRGYACTVVAGATDTRDLPDQNGGVIEAQTVKQVALAGLADYFAKVVGSAEDIAD